jgi:hypothetical protein
VFKAAREIETTQENVQDWLELDEGDCSNIFVFIFISTNCIIKFSIYLASECFLSCRATYINPNYRLIRMAFPSIRVDQRGFTVNEFL